MPSYNKYNTFAQKKCLKIYEDHVYLAGAGTPAIGFNPVQEMENSLSYRKVQRKIT
jgi:hypothetical protein